NGHLSNDNNFSVGGKRWSMSAHRWGAVPPKAASMLHSFHELTIRRFAPFEWIASFGHTCHWIFRAFEWATRALEWASRSPTEAFEVKSLLRSLGSVGTFVFRPLF